MSIFEIFLIGIGLSMDAFAVAICKGLGMTKINIKQCLVIALFFGGFQGIMPFLGWLIGGLFANKIVAIDHWIAFILLLYIGGKMVIEAIKDWKTEEVVEEKDKPLDIKELFILAIATSIDALACGVTFSFDKTINIFSSVIMIGITTFVISAGGVYVGNYFGSKYEKKAELIGGIILIGIGTKILVSHLLGM